MSSWWTDPKALLLVAYVITGVVFSARLIAALRQSWRERPVDDSTPKITMAGVVTGFITNALDTLGIGSFATTTSIFRNWRLVRDELIPGTLNAGHAIPTFVEALIFTRIVPVGSTTLITMIAAAAAGAWLGASNIARWPRRAVQLGMGSALIVVALLMLLSQLGIGPAPGAALSLSGPRLGLAIAGNFVFGAFMTLGIGLYAPCLMLVSLLGMSPAAAFPIMMGSCAMLMPAASAPFIRARRFDPVITRGVAVGGTPAVVLAAYVIKSLPLTMLRWLVVAVIVYTAISLLRTARRERITPGAPAVSAA